MAAMLNTLQSAMKVGDLRRRILFTAYMFLVFRIGSHIPVPGVNQAVVEKFFTTGGGFFGLLNMFSGGAFFSFSVLAMSITPYINASIIMQLLTVVFPKLEQLAKEGEEGRKKITQYTRYGTIILGLVEAFGITMGVSRLPGSFYHPGILAVVLSTLSLTAGTAFLMWLGEMITDRGIGNGISLIIFAGIVSQIPLGAEDMFRYLRAGTLSGFDAGLLLLAAVGIIAVVVLFQEAQRRIPVQYAKRVVGRRIYGGQTTHIPLKVNSAGVIPVIFAISIMMFPVTLAQFIHAPWAQNLLGYLSFGSAPYIAGEFLLVFFFTYFYTAVVFNPKDVAENMKKYGGFVPGIRPGKPTAQFLERIMVRVTLVGAVFLGLIAVLPNFLTDLTGLQMYFGGTALLIVVGVALETMKQIEAHLLMRHYQGFLR
jgi:preprotein translocase subunit SecY